MQKTCPRRNSMIRKNQFRSELQQFKRVCSSTDVWIVSNLRLQYRTCNPLNDALFNEPKDLPHGSGFHPDPQLSGVVRQTAKGAGIQVDSQDPSF